MTRSRPTAGLSIWALCILGCGPSDDVDSDTAAATQTTTGSGSQSEDAGSEGSSASGGIEGTGSTGAQEDGSTEGTTGGPPPIDDPIPEEFRFCEGEPPGAVHQADPTNYRDLIGEMDPGDVLSFAAGNYADGFSIYDMHGEADRCFYFEGPADGGAVLLGRSDRNTLQIRDSSYIVVRNLEFDGNGEVGDAIKAQGGEGSYAHHILLESLHIHAHDLDQQIVGISTKSTASHWVIRGNRLERIGTGLYLGDSPGTSPFVSGLIEHNVVLDTVGYNMQIKHQNGRPDLVGLPELAMTIIRHNVFSKENGASTGGDARPNVLLGHFPTSGAGTDDHYLVYGNFFFDNPTEALMQAEGNVAVYNNVLFNPSGTALRIQPHNDVPREIEVFFNTVLAAGGGIGVTGGHQDFAQLVAGNASFAGGNAIAGGEQSDNVSGSFDEAAQFLSQPAAPPGGGFDLHPADGQLGSTIDGTAFESFLRWDHDFDGRPRDGSFAGAYFGPGDESSWPLDRDFKP